MHAWLLQAISVGTRLGAPAAPAAAGLRLVREIPGGPGAPSLLEARPA